MCMFVCGIQLRRSESLTGSRWCRASRRQSLMFALIRRRDIKDVNRIKPALLMKFCKQQLIFCNQQLQYQQAVTSVWGRFVSWWCWRNWCVRFQGLIQGVSRVSGHPPFWLWCPFFEKNIFSIYVFLAEQGASLFVKTMQELNHRFPIYAF